MRIAKYLAHAGVASRRAAENLIIQGRVKINGQVVTELGARINEKQDRIEVNGQMVALEPKIYVLLYKPANYLSSVKDPYYRSTVLDLLKNISVRIYPVGRLDYDTEGLLLLTNDGEFTNLMLHPRYKIRKKYEVWVKGSLEREKLGQLKKGVVLEEGLTSADRVDVIRQEKDRTLVEITIHEGRKRQVKRMMQALGKPVLHLKRTGFAFLTLQGLKAGEYRELVDYEVAELIRLARGEIEHNQERINRR